MDEDVLNNLDESVRSLLKWETAPIILLLSVDLHSNINYGKVPGGGAIIVIVHALNNFNCQSIKVQ